MAGLRLQISRARQASVAFTDNNTNAETLSTRLTPPVAFVGVRGAFARAIPLGAAFAGQDTLARHPSILPALAND